MKRLFFGLCILLILPALIAAQTSAKAPLNKVTLEFVDGGTTLSVTSADGVVKKYPSGIAETDEIPAGSTIVTGSDTMAELKMKPNGTIIKIAKATTFKITSLASTAKETNAFALAAGKIRAVASKGAQYSVTSQTAVCAVRGTDFSVDTGDDGKSKAVLMVAKGLVDFTNAAGTKLSIGAGEAADAMAATFAAFKYTADQFASQFGDVDFKDLKVEDVPAAAPEAVSAGLVDASGQPAAGQQLTPDQAASALTPTAAQAESGIMKWLRDNMGFEIGSVTMPDGLTYSKAIIQPEFSLGKVKMGLYLPVIYSSDLFNPKDWYHPAGNDEWSFGSEKFAEKDYINGAIDLLQDVALKIKYFEFGTQMRDPFFIKIGNLNDLTLGHGLIMRNYANDTDFPSVRRIGFNLGIDGKGGGIELLSKDLTQIASTNQILGARGYFKVVGNFALGASAVVDTDPGYQDPTLKGNMWLIGTGVDLDLPIVASDLLTIRGFVDGAVTLPFATKDFAWTYKDANNVTQTAQIKAGDGTSLVFDPNNATEPFKNWGAAGGLMGNILVVDYRLEYRYFTGNFKPSFFDSTYDRMRGQYAAQYIGYLANPVAYDATPKVMGIYGEGGFKFLKDKLTFNFGYMWPWSLDYGTDFKKQLENVGNNDELHAKLVVKKGLIPIFDVAGSISYDRRGLVKSIQAAADGTETFSLFNENTVFGGELLVPVPKTPQLDLAIGFKTVPVTNDTGGIVYKDEAAGIPELKPSISIETRFHF